ncbi:MAG TPA: hypothetical protein VJZ71_01360 [Phycisphaerae bacterium]|nr:hypothetical protein [Phycisphaerae bacterium]
MKTTVSGIPWLAALGLCAACGCAANEYTRLNSPPQGEAPCHPTWTDYYTYHNDQGMLADMSIADIHFVPHSTCLSGVGEARLERYAELLAARGGTLNYDTAMNDPKLLDARLQAARDFLAQACPGGQPVDVLVGPAGGRGMSNKEASEGAAVAQQAEPRKNAYYLNENKAFEKQGD